MFCVYNSYRGIRHKENKETTQEEQEGNKRMKIRAEEKTIKCKIRGTLTDERSRIEYLNKFHHQLSMIGNTGS